MRIAYLSLGIIIGIFELLRKKKYGLFDLLTVVNLFFAIYYCLVPFGLMTLDITQFYEDWALPAIIRQFYYSQLDLVTPFFRILITYVITIFVYFKAQKIHFIFGKPKKVTYMEKEISYVKLKYIAVVFILLGIVGLMTFTMSAGGIINTILLAEYYRSGDLSNDSSLLIMRIFQPFIVSGFFLIESLYIDEHYHKLDKKNKFLIVFLRFIAFIFNIYYLLISSSRAKIVIFVACVLLLHKSSVKIKEVILVGVFVLFLYIYGDALLAGRELEIQDMIRSIAKVLEQTAFPFVNICKLDDIDTVLDNYRFFMDLIYVWIINLIPTGILGIFGLKKIPNLYIYNTALIESTSNIPVDYVSFGFWQLGNIGIIINAIFFGWFLTRLERILSGKQKVIYLIYLRVIFAIFGILANYETENVIRGNLDTVVLIVLYLYFARNKNIKKKEMVTY